jgi:hypothetical protein
MRKGQKQSDEARARMSETKRVPLGQRIEEDRERLRLLAQTDKFLWGEKFGCSDKVAAKRLNRLVEAGYAQRFRPRGATAFTYTIAIPAGAQVISRKSPRKQRKEHEAPES